MTSAFYYGSGKEGGAAAAMSSVPIENDGRLSRSSGLDTPTDYCPFCQRSEVLLDVCACKENELAQSDKRQGNSNNGGGGGLASPATHCECAAHCRCAACHPWEHKDKQQDSGGGGGGGDGHSPLLQHIAATRNSMQCDTMEMERRAAAAATAAAADRQQQVPGPIHQPSHGPFWRRASTSSVNNTDTCSRPPMRRRTMSIGGPHAMREFMRHKDTCECKGSGVGCQCGRFCTCGQ